MGSRLGWSLPPIPMKREQHANGSPKAVKNVPPSNTINLMATSIVNFTTNGTLFMELTQETIISTHNNESDDYSSKCTYRMNWASGGTVGG